MEGLGKKVNWPRSGTYVVAVSGGVDSMSLLHMLMRRGGYELIAAHFDHGLRPDSDEDRKLVQEFAERHRLVFESKIARLGSSSEADARSARYDWLLHIRQLHEADALMTAHHLDDRLETMLLNQARGAGWYGLSPLHETAVLKRPLLAIGKEEIRTYARIHEVPYLEDPTNRDPGHTPRNAIRQQLANQDKADVLRQLQEHDNYRQRRLAQLEPIVSSAAVIAEGHIELSRSRLLQVDSTTARDVLYLLLQPLQEQLELDRDAVLRLEHFCKTARPGKRLPLSKNVEVEAQSDRIRVSPKRHFIYTNELE